MTPKEKILEEFEKMFPHLEEPEMEPYQPSKSMSVLTSTGVHFDRSEAVKTFLSQALDEYLQAYKDKLNDEGLGEHPKLEPGFCDPQEMQNIVQDYFKNVLDLPCPNFTFNLEQKKNAGV